MKFFLELKKSFLNILNSIPIMLGVLLLINLIQPLMKDVYPKVFSGNYFTDTFVGAFFGSISFGMPVTSYIVGGELLKNGVSLLAVSAFVMSWTTVGIAMLPLEASFLGKKFAILRNLINFVFAICISVLTVLTLNLLNFL